MREVFHQSLDDLHERVVEIARRVERAMRAATEAFATGDVARAEGVIAADDAIDEAALALDELAIETLARQQPVAGDLRIVVMSLRVSASLERMGDIAEHIAQLTRMRYPEQVSPSALRSTFVRMGALDVEMAQMLVDLLRTRDLELADRIRDADDEMDRLHATVFERVLGDRWHGEAEATVDVTLASRYHERFADHAVSVAEKVRYLATGDWVGPSPG